MGREQEGVVSSRNIEGPDRKIVSMKPDAINPATGVEYTRDEVETAREKRKLLSAGSIGGFVIGGLGVAGFLVTWVF